ncbi:MAG: hypothetical protein DME97_01850 [Verrucomicrobia bacterium]|nr:MAG: hypothetical protein DME97_01850 [Verrucomicrobiota bacterium]
MLESILFVAGFALVLAGALSFLYPLRWLGIPTRGIAVLVMAGGFLVVAIGAGMIDSYLVYLGFALFFAGLISLIRPSRFVYIQTRRRALMVSGVGLLLAVGILFLPYRDQEAANHVTKLDDWMPRWQVGERHVLKVAAPPAKVFTAIHEVRADEILLFRTLTAIRRCGGTGPESVLNAPEQKPLLDVATQTTFVLLEDEAPRELVIGTVIAAPRAARGSGRLEPDLFRKTLRPGVVLATMNFIVTPAEDGGSTIATETRICANSPAALRQFGIYWRLIHPGSDIIRRMWLRAIARRAEESRLTAR